MSDSMRSEFAEYAKKESLPTSLDGTYGEKYMDGATAIAWRAWQAARTVPEGCMVVNAKWLERHAGPEDHACVRCYPHSDMLIDGFSCYYHKALDVIAAAPEGKR